MSTFDSTPANEALAAFVLHFESLSLDDRRAVAESILENAGDDLPAGPLPAIGPDEEALYERFRVAVLECLQ